MGGLLSGLGELGLENLEGMDLYEDPKQKNEQDKEANSSNVLVIKETDFLFDKTTECPVCYEEFKARTMKVGKAKLNRTDLDLRPIYENIEPLKYDVILCPHCGYAALSRYFKGITASQGKLIKENISKAYHRADLKHEVYDYEEAFNRYKLSLANAIVKHAKASEKAYICLKAGWLLRSWQESLDKNETGTTAKIEELKKQETDFLKNALEGFLSARQTDGYPMCGMDEITMEYLVAVLAMEFEQFDISSRIIAEILTSNSATSRMKDKAREVKELLIAKIKEKSAK